MTHDLMALIGTLYLLLASAGSVVALSYIAIRVKRALQRRIARRAIDRMKRELARASSWAQPDDFAAGRVMWR